MFKRKVLPFGDILNEVMRENGLETPLLQRRVIEAWDDIVGPIIARLTHEKYIQNQTLFVKISNPALRADLSMHRTELVRKLNAQVGSHILADLRIY